MGDQLMKGIGLLLGTLLFLCMTGWGSLALFIDGPGSENARLGLAIAYAVLELILVCAFVFSKRRWTTAFIFIGLFIILVGWWVSLSPSNDREWQPEVAVLPYATFEQDQVTIHNVRNFDYRTETDFTVRYDDRTFDLRTLNAVDVIAVYWMGPMIAHVFLSFGFGEEHLAISIEARKERTEGYSTLKGFFKQFELFYVVGDERDVIRVRTNYRKDPPEDVYLFRVNVPQENIRRLFLDYVRHMNQLREQPEFYNTLTTNCTTTILMHTHVNPDHLPFSWKVLLSGYLPEYVYEAGRLNTSLPFPVLFQHSHINARAQAADQAPDFSRYIRSGLPMNASERYE
jgi:hypothetical protein